MTHPNTTRPADERIHPGIDGPRRTAGQWRPAAALANPCPASTLVDFATWLLLDKTVAHCPTCRAYTLSTTSGMAPHEPKKATP